MKKLLVAFTASFAIVGNLVAVGLYFAPTKWHPSADLVFAICLPAILTITVDPSFAAVALILAPLNAIVYGLVDLMIGGLASELAGVRCAN
jgi:hypothetical protein